MRLTTSPITPSFSSVSPDSSLKKAETSAPKPVSTSSYEAQNYTVKWYTKSLVTKEKRGFSLHNAEFRDFKTSKTTTCLLFLTPDFKTAQAFTQKQQQFFTGKDAKFIFIPFKKLHIECDRQRYYGVALRTKVQPKVPFTDQPYSALPSLRDASDAKKRELMTSLLEGMYCLTKKNIVYLHWQPESLIYSKEDNKAFFYYFSFAEQIFRWDDKSLSGQTCCYPITWKSLKSLTFQMCHDWNPKEPNTWEDYRDPDAHRLANICYFIATGNPPASAPLDPSQMDPSLSVPMKKFFKHLWKRESVYSSLSQPFLEYKGTHEDKEYSLTFSFIPAYNCPLHNHKLFRATFYNKKTKTSEPCFFVTMNSYAQSLLDPPPFKENCKPEESTLNHCARFLKKLKDEKISPSIASVLREELSFEIFDHPYKGFLIRDSSYLTLAEVMDQKKFPDEQSVRGAMKQIIEVVSALHHKKISCSSTFFQTLLLDSKDLTPLFHDFQYGRQFKEDEKIIARVTCLPKIGPCRT